MTQHRYIYRLPPKRPGASPAWVVKKDSTPGFGYTTFTDQKFGSESSALEAAIAHRDGLIARFGLQEDLNRPENDYPGVSRTAPEYGQDGAMLKVGHWQAYWIKLDGNQATKRFSVKRYGEDEARRLAIEARERAERALQEGTDPFFELPPGQAALWRYMDFTKFLSLLEDSALFFSEAANFDDPYEGVLAHANVWRRNFVMSKTRARRNTVAAPDVQSPQLAISCWYAAKHESAAMWSLYSKSTDAIAIKTSVRKLRAALPPKAKMGLVKYIDYRKTWIPEHNPLLRYFHKRLSFQHEHELRAVLELSEPELNLAGRPSAGGFKLAISVNHLIDEIYIGPKSTDWFVELVSAICKRYGVKAMPVRSSLYDGPVL